MPSPVKSPLEAGLAALKQRNYHTAITQLESVANPQDNSKASLQAQVGLVIAYARTSQVPQAIAICEYLIQNQNPQVQDWARRALEYLTTGDKSSVEPPQESATGFVPFDNSPVPPPPPPQPKKTVLTQKTTLASVLPSPGLQVSHSNDFTTKAVTSHSLPNSSVAVNPPSPSNESSTESFQFYWRQAGRAKVWQPLHKPNLIPSRLLTLATFMALFTVLREILKYVMSFINQTLDKLPFVEPLQWLYQDPTSVLLTVLVILMASSPWLLDRLMLEFYGQKELSKETLHNHSREAVRVLQRRQKLMPNLRILPLAAPIALTYGNLPRTARIVVSQGLLNQLGEDEIAAIYAFSMGQIQQWDLPVMSLLLLVTMPIYRLYHQWSDWANSISQRYYHWLVAAIASIAYGIWCMLTGTALLNSRYRMEECDRTATEITGNPNGLIRALLKMTMGIAGDITRQEHTSWQLESLNLFMPVSYQQSLCVGSFAEHMSWESLLMWENVNPYRQWFTINNSHPMIGDRIQRLCQIARHWHLETELQLTSQKSLPVLPGSFLLNIAPWLGIPLGFAFAGILWLTWQTAFALRLINLKWIYDNWSFVMGCLLIGFSVGMILRINYFFPDIKSATVQTDSQLLKVLGNPSTLPINCVSVSLIGRLLGRRGTNNYLAQDLILQTSVGLVKLHHIPGSGQSINPQDWIGRKINVTGWFRRGATPWIDIQTLQTQNGKTIHSYHPIWSTILAIIAQAWGAYIFLRG